MRKLINSDVFAGLKPEIHKVDGAAKYYSSGEIKKYSVVIMPPRPEWSMLWSDTIYHQVLGENFHHMREDANFLAIEYIKEGSVFFRQNGQAYLAEKGDVCLMHPGCVNEIMTGVNGHCAKSSVVIVGPSLRSMLESSGLAKVDMLESVDTGHFETILDILEKLSHDLGDAAALQLSCYAYEIIQIIARNDKCQNIPDRLLELLEFMKSNIEQKLTLDIMAEKCGCSVPHLIRLFKDNFNLSPYKMLSRMRMREAAHLLVNKLLSVKEVACHVGYQNQLNFSTEFKKYYQLSPKQYRKSKVIV